MPRRDRSLRLVFIHHAFTWRFISIYSLFHNEHDFLKSADMKKSRCRLIRQWTGGGAVTANLGAYICCTELQRYITSHLSKNIINNGTISIVARPWKRDTGDMLLWWLRRVRCAFPRHAITNCRTEGLQGAPRTTHVSLPACVFCGWSCCYIRSAPENSS